MSDEKLDKVLGGIQDIKISQAVHYEQITQLSSRMDKAYSRIDRAEDNIQETDRKIDISKAELGDRIAEEIQPLVKKVSMHDKVVGAIAIAATIILMLIRLKLI